LATRVPLLVSFTSYNKAYSITYKKRPTLLNSLITVVPALINIYMVESSPRFVTTVVAIGIAASVALWTLTTCALVPNWIDEE
jgi:hypothetical protein